MTNAMTPPLSPCSDEIRLRAGPVRPAGGLPERAGGLAAGGGGAREGDPEGEPPGRDRGQ